MGMGEGVSIKEKRRKGAREHRGGYSLCLFVSPYFHFPLLSQSLISFCKGSANFSTFPFKTLSIRRRPQQIFVFQPFHITRTHTPSPSYHTFSSFLFLFFHCLFLFREKMDYVNYLKSKLYLNPYKQQEDINLEVEEEI